MRQPTAHEIVAFIKENRNVDDLYESYRAWIIFHKMECPMQAYDRRNGYEE